MYFLNIKKKSYCGGILFNSQISVVLRGIIDVKRHTRFLENSNHFTYDKILQF